jgi:hypothetical protein
VLYIGARVVAAWEPVLGGAGRVVAAADVKYTNGGLSNSRPCVHKLGGTDVHCDAQGSCLTFYARAVLFDSIK